MNKKDKTIEMAAKGERLHIENRYPTEDERIKMERLELSLKLINLLPPPAYNDADGHQLDIKQERINTCNWSVRVLRMADYLIENNKNWKDGKDPFDLITTPEGFI